MYQMNGYSLIAGIRYEKDYYAVESREQADEYAKINPLDLSACFRGPRYGEWFVW